MKKKIFRYLAMTFAILAIAWIGMALVPPPPANQNLGAYDTHVSQLAESNCRVCHSSGVPDKHHLLVSSGEYGCQDCHPTLPGGTGITIDRNCIVCHNGSAFYANPNLKPGIPHHNTTWAYQDKNCTKCHGSYVDNATDGHYIPTYNQSLVTPNTSYKTVNLTTGRKWGGCEACHVANTTVSPRIYDNNNTHHNLGKVTEGYPTPGAGCLTCHNTNVGALNIRTCEKCHGVKSLHNIQFEYVNNGPLGKGHINNNWDCMGCHAWFGFAAAPYQGAIIPEINTIAPLNMKAGVATQVTITGTNFINDLYTSVVSVDGVAVVPTSLTNTQIVATVPALAVGKHEIQVVKADARSRLYTLVAVPPVDITSATFDKKKKTLTISGTGFGSSKPDPLYKDLGVWIGSNKVASSDITSWTDNMIIVKTKSASASGTVTVKALFGQDNERIR